VLASRARQPTQPGRFERGRDRVVGSGMRTLRGSDEPRVLGARRARLLQRLRERLAFPPFEPCALREGRRPQRPSRPVPTRPWLLSLWRLLDELRLRGCKHPRSLGRVARVALVFGRRAFHQAAPAALLPREAFRSDPIMVRHHSGPIHGGRETPIDVSDDSTLSPRKALLLQFAAHLVRQLLRAKGPTYQAIAKWLGVTVAMARRRVLRHEWMLREAAKTTDRG
jgi:hypothetical protein